VTGLETRKAILRWYGAKPFSQVDGLPAPDIVIRRDNSPTMARTFGLFCARNPAMVKPQVPALAEPPWRLQSGVAFHNADYKGWATEKQTHAPKRELRVFRGPGLPARETGRLLPSCPKSTSVQRQLGT
jgi:hypothetical protein